VAFLHTLKRPPALVALEELIARSELVIEATTQAALQMIVPKTLAQGKDLMVLSVGGLLGRAHWFQLAEEQGCHIYIPSGAVAGLDGVRAACQAAVDSVTLITRKPPQAFAGVSYNVHQIEVRGEFGRFTVEVENVPSEANPRTSKLAYLSAFVTLERIAATTSIGT
jgi:aspartate dehydrogenase